MVVPPKAHFWLLALQWRRQRRGKRDLKIKIINCATLTILRLPHLVRILHFGEEHYNWIGLHTVKSITENWRFAVVCSSCHQNGKRGNLTVLFCRGQHGIVHKCVSHLQHPYFSSLEQWKFLISLLKFSVP